MRYAIQCDICTQAFCTTAGNGSNAGAGGSDDSELPFSSKHVDAMNDEGAQEGLEEGVLAGSIDAAAAGALAEYKRSMAEGTAGGEAALMEQDEARRW